MNQIIPLIFKGLAVAFDKIPVLNKLKGYRAALGLVVRGALLGLDVANVGGGHLSATYGVYLDVFTGLALNAKVNQ